MYSLSDEQITYIQSDIKQKGIEIEDLQLNLLDHICCILERNMKDDDDFETSYQTAILQFYRKELYEIEEETINLLTFKNYYTMKKTMFISGTISVTAMITGSLFKIMHWPGASALLVLGIACISFLFLPLLFILKTKEVSTSRDKLIAALGSLVGILFCLSVLFTVMHWPGSRILWYVTLLVSSCIFIPVYFFSGLRHPETKVNTIVSSILMMMAVGLHFTLINTRPANPEVKMFTYLQSELLLERMQEEESMHPFAKMENNALVSEIQNNCEQIKGLILENETGEKILPKDFVSKKIIIDERNMDINFYGDPKGLKLWTDLKAAVLKYNATLAMKSANRIPIENSILDIDREKIGSYSNLFFLNSITMLQLYLANNQNKK